MINQREKKLENKRLVYFQHTPSIEYWDAYWSDLITPEYYKKYFDGNLDEYEHLFTKYLKRDGLIIEAGCGTGKYVLALRQRGYCVEGVEWGGETVRKVKYLFPDLPIAEGNVINLDVPGNYYDGYISLGVVEHRREGPEPFLIEAHRVLKPGGIALFSVPYFNLIRKIKGWMGLFRFDILEHWKFYQYAFSRSEFCKILNQTGFSVLETHGLAGYYGLKEELGFLFDWLDRVPGGWRIKHSIKSFKWTDFLGHVMMFVAIKR